MGVRYLRYFASCRSSNAPSLCPPCPRTVSKFHSRVWVAFYKILIINTMGWMQACTRSPWLELCQHGENPVCRAE